MGKLRPSPAVTVSEHTSIGETLRILIENKVGSVIITSYSTPHKPVGIFTERDLLKWVFQIRDSNQWSAAIGTIMTKKLITLSILNLDQANSLMLINNIRHLPIVYNDDNGEECLAGMISMRDAFRVMVEEENQIDKTAKEIELAQKPIVIMAKNIRERNLQRNILSSYSNLKIINENFEQEPDTKKLLETVHKAKILILDIDDFSKKFWPFFLKLILDEPSHPNIFIVFNPYLHEKTSIDILKTISKGKAVHAFSKPLSLIQYLSQIESALNSK